jgi:hypothetical protein
MDFSMIGRCGMGQYICHVIEVSAAAVMSKSRSVKGLLLETLLRQSSCQDLPLKF